MLEKDIKKVTDGVYPFHMPGHKRQKEWLCGLYEGDVTEISGADDLHAPSGIIAEAQKRATELFGTQETILLTGGSTCGILSSISAACDKKDKIIVARNCHKSVYNACLINDLTVSYIYPQPEYRLGCFGAVAPYQVADTMDKSGAKVVVITSPTYEGVVSDIKGIADEVHNRDGILIVDSAHGSHLGFNDFFPKSARQLGADMVIESAHKTLPCLTGAALLHICSSKVDYNEVQNQLGIFETSSPSYPIMCSIDRFVSRAAQTDLFTPYIKRLNAFYTAAKALKNLYILRTDDPSKLVISVKNANITGFELKNLLRERYSIELEMAMPDYALGMTSVADADEGFARLISALYQIDKNLSPINKPRPLFPPKAEAAGSIYIPKNNTYQCLSHKECAGKISAEFVYAYPPGSPIITPNEVFSEEIIEYIDHLSDAGAQIYSSKGYFPEFIWILAEKD